jgi:NAD(P)-dependent dehydrogenase (short-subunit alcohol dehydrogenase family)
MKSGAVILVTGAATGFGRLIAETLARKRYRVFATMRDVSGRNAPAAGEIRALASRESLSLEPREIDVTDDVSVERGVKEVRAAAGRIDVLVNNAGSAMVDLAESVTAAQAQQLFDTNFFGAVRMNRAVLPTMRQQGSGLLLHMSSGAGRMVFPGMAFYCASKHALEVLAEAYRYELASLGVDSVLIEPGAYPTPIMSKIQDGGGDPDRNRSYGAAAEIPEKVRAQLMSAKGDPQEIADVVAQVIETPAGQRKLRYRVPAGASGIDRINALTDELEVQVMERFGITEVTRFRTPKPPA